LRYCRLNQMKKGKRILVSYVVMSAIMNKDGQQLNINESACGGHTCHFVK
jgi:hypothetical protein